MLQCNRLIAAAASFAITGMLLAVALLIGNYGTKLFALGLDHHQWWWSPVFWTTWTLIIFFNMLRSRTRAAKRSAQETSV